jgi:hypothetical protein
MSANMKRQAPVSDESSERDDKRKRAESTDSQPRIENCPLGVIFFSVMNKRRQYFLPSVKNFFGQLQIHKLLCDSGCSSSLLPIDSLETLSEILNWAGTSFKISGGKSPGNTTISLTVTKKSVFAKFSIELCSDIIDAPTFSVDHLRFALSSDDIAWILDNECAKSKFADYEIVRLRAETKLHARRTHGLIGQQILDQFASFKCVGCEIYVDPSQYIWLSSFDDLRHQLIDLVGQTKEGLPDTFDDWEDDDFAFDDDDYIVDEEI